MGFYEEFVRQCNMVGKTPSAVALEVGISKPTVTQWKKGGGVTDATKMRVEDYFRRQSAKEGEEIMNKDFIPKDKRLLPKEGEEQARLFSWTRMMAHQHPELELLFHIPNGGSRTKAEAGRFKAEGVKAGVPDLFLPVARGEFHGLFIEMKRIDGGRVSAEQKAWMDKLRAQGYEAVVCRGWEGASEALLRYLGKAPAYVGKTDCTLKGRPHGPRAALAMTDPSRAMTDPSRAMTDPSREESRKVYGLAEDACPRKTGGVVLT